MSAFLFRMPSYSFLRTARRIAVAAALTACGGGDGGTDPDDEVETVSVSAARNTPLAPGDSVLVTAVPRDASGFPIRGRPITWTSANETVATVSRRTDSTAMVVAEGSGSAEIRATVGDVVGRQTVVVAEPTPTRRIVGVSAARDHTCAVGEEGTGWCWGSNPDGLLGDGTTTTRRSPTPVNGVHEWSAVSAGEQHTCALDAAGAAWCWGANFSGALGDSSGVHQRSPSPVRGGHSFTRIAAGRLSSCGITTLGVLYCWGNGQNGRLGNGASFGDSPVPVRVASDVTFRELSLGAQHACALATDGRVFCWGDNFSGRLGDGTTENRNAPVLAAGGQTFDGVSVGLFHSCAWRASGGTWCWGSNEDRAFGTVTPTSSATAVQAQTVAYSSISSGPTARRVCGVRASDASGWCWGSGYPAGPALVPGTAAGSGTWARFTVGSNHACGINTDGTVVCWGFWWLIGQPEGAPPEEGPLPVFFP